MVRGRVWCVGTGRREAHEVVGEFEAEGVGEEEEDLVLGVVDARSRDVARDAANRLSFAWETYREWD